MNLTRRQFIGLSAGLSLGALYAPHTLAQLPALGNTFRFAAINDIHITDEASVAILEKAVSRINAESGITFTIVLGDVGSWGLESEMALGKTALDNLDKPYCCIPGNHDVTAKKEEAYKNYDAAFAHRQWQETSEDGAWVFIGLDTCNGVASDVTLPPDRLEWLKAQLEHINPTQPICLFAHHPLNPNTKAYRVKNADDILALFKEHDLRLVASGHYHGNQIEEANGILFTTTACCSTTRNNFDGTVEKGIRFYTIDNANLTHDFVVIA